jgi:hypothetical protein
MATKAPLSLYADSPEAEKVVQEYRDQQKLLMDSLVNRKQLFDPTLLAMAQGFLSPTKSGTFGESLGNVAGAVAPVQQAEEKRAQDIARMRFDMAQQNLQSYQATQGDRAFRDALSRRGPQPSGQPAATPDGQPSQPGAASGQPVGEAPQGLRSITTNDIALVAASPNGMPKADFLLKLQDNERGRFKTVDGQVIDMDAPGGPKLFADFRSVKQEPTEIVVRGQPLNLNMTPTELREFNDAYRKGQGDEYFEKNLKGRRTDINLPASGGDLKEITVPLLGDVVFRGTPRQAAMVEKLSEDAIKTNNPTSLKAYVDSLTKQMPMPAAPTAPAPQAVARPTAPAAPQAQATPAAPGQPPMPAVAGRTPSAQAAPQPAPQPAAQPAAQPEPTSDLAGLPLADQNREMLARLSAADKPAQETMATLMKSAGPETTVASNQRLKELVTIINNNPKVVGLMNQQGVVAGIAAAAQQGLQVGSTSVSLPVTTFLEKQKLTPQEQQIARRVGQLLDQEFFTRAAIAKSALGPQISNTDAIAMRSPMARPEDGAQLIKYWSLHGVLVNRQNDDLVNSYNSWMNSTKGRQPARQYWNTEGRKILNQYTPYFEKLEKDFSPTGSR